MRRIDDIIKSRKVTVDEYYKAKNICNIYESKLNFSGLLDTKILDYGFTVRTNNCIRVMFDDDWRDKTLKDLKEFIDINGKNDLMKYRNFGNKSWNEISDALTPFVQ